MRIKTRIYSFQLVIAASILFMAGLLYTTILSSNYYLKRLQLVNDQRDAVTTLQVAATRFSEQIVNLLVGAPPGEFERSRSELEQNFVRLEKMIRGELAGEQEQRQDLDELYRLQRLRALYGEINQFVTQMRAFREEGRLEDAVAVFRRDIETRLDVEFANLVTAAVLDERDDVGLVEDRAETLGRNLAVVGLVAGLAAFAFAIVAGPLLIGALVRPIKLLTTGAEAVSRGEFEHRIMYDSPDEIGALAQRFNTMAGLQQQQRALLLQARADLERQVEDRTRELGTANKRLTDLDRLRVQFLADISHELRTPLTALRGEAEVTLRHAPQQTELYRETLVRIVTQASEMSRLVDDLLFLARTESDTIRFERRRVRLQDLAMDTVREAETLAERKGIRIETENSPEPAWVEADAQRLKQALMIVLDNAIKYSPPGSPAVVRMCAAKGCAEVSVRDQGVGIPAEEIPKIFERFYRGRISGPGEGGTGLGLAIAKWLVEKHDGEIAVASEEGRFTEVRIRIPTLEVRSLVEDPAG